jgi:hypothetical protein
MLGKEELESRGLVEIRKKRKRNRLKTDNPRENDSLKRSRHLHLHLLHHPMITKAIVNLLNHRYLKAYSHGVGQEARNLIMRRTLQ